MATKKKNKATTEATGEKKREVATAADATAVKPAEAAKTPWGAIIGGVALVGVIGWALTRGDTKPDAAADAGAGATTGSLALPSDGGLGMEDLVVGTGAVATKGDTVKVHYVGTLTNGTEFDSSRKHGQPFDFRLGAGEVIQGWDLGVAGMKVGGKRKLMIPSSLGYGKSGQPPVIPPDATLVFEVELLDTGKPKPKPRPEPPIAPDDPLKGSFSLADATKNIKGTGDLTAKIDTSLGLLTCRLYEDKAPITVANFVGLATGERTYKDPKDNKEGKWVNKPWYDGTTFHRIIKGFMIQGGDRLGNGTGEPGYVIKDEIWEGAKHDRIGLLCMANRGHDTNGGQFFITEEPKESLDGNYTIFGECGPNELIKQIASVKTLPGDKPETPVVIKTVKISRVPKP